MRGADEVTAARLRGMPITDVFITLHGGAAPKRIPGTAVHRGKYGYIGAVDIEGDDQIDRLDLRFCHAVTVHITPIDESRRIDLLDRVLQFSPRWVAVGGEGTLVLWDQQGGLREWAPSTN